MSLDPKFVESRFENSAFALAASADERVVVLRLAVPHVPPYDDQSVGLASLIIVGTQAHLFVR